VEEEKWVSGGRRRKRKGKWVRKERYELKVGKTN